MDALPIFQLASSILTPLIVGWLLLLANDRRRAMAEKLESIEDQLRDLRSEMRASQKNCADDIRAILAQLAEYPRRREMQDSVSELWRAFRHRGAGE